MKDEEDIISEYEEWVMDNMIDDSEPSIDDEESVDEVDDNDDNDDNDESSDEEEDDDEDEISDLERFRGDGTRDAKISMNHQMQLTLRLVTSILVVVVIVMIIAKAVFAPVTVVGNSMYPTMKDGDILRTTTEIKKENIYINSIVCFQRGNVKHIIKRVVGLPGDTISFKDGRVVVNGMIREDNYPLMEEYPDTEIKLGEDEFYCLGDNRNNSKDSRYYGPINISEITNIVVFNQTSSKESINDVQELYKLYKDGILTTATPGDAIPDLATQGDAIYDWATQGDASEAEILEKLIESNKEKED